MNETVLRKRNLNLKRGDVELLTLSSWLYDSHISFYYTVIEETFSSSFYIVYPPIAVMLEVIDADLLDDVLGTQIRDEDPSLVLVPINDRPREQINELAGTHWTLLVHDRSGDEFYYYDSSGSRYLMPKVADIARRLCVWLGGEDGVPPITVVSFKGQTNSSYCGDFVLRISEHIIETFSARGRAEFGVPDSVSDEVNSSAFRKRLMETMSEQVQKRPRPGATPPIRETNL